MTDPASISCDFAETITIVGVGVDRRLPRGGFEESGFQEGKFWVWDEMPNGWRRLNPSA